MTLTILIMNVLALSIHYTIFHSDIKPPIFAAKRYPTLGWGDSAADLTFIETSVFANTPPTKRITAHYVALNHHLMCLISNV